MATNLSSTGLEIDKVEESDIPSGASDKILLYASGSGSDTRIYVKEGNNTQKQLGFDIDQLDALGGTGVAQGDHFAFSDDGTEKKITFSNLEDAIFANMNSESSDVAVAAGGAITLADNSVGTAEIATAIAGDGLTGGGGSALAVQVSGSVVIASDKVGLSGSVAGDGLSYAGGVDSISSLALDISEFSDVAVASGDKFLMLDSDGSTHQLESVDDVATFMAGDGLAASSGVLAVGVDDSSIELNSDALRVKALGVTNAMLAGSIANAKLANDSVTIGSTEIDLGATSTVLAGITQLTASNIQVTNLDVVTVNSINQTETTLEISDKLIVAALSASSANSDGGGLKIGGGQNSDGNASILYDHSNTALDFNIGGTTEVRLADGVFRPETDNDVDLGASGAEFKDLYLDGVAYIDDLRADQLGAALDANNQAITNINVDSGAIDGATIGANSAAAGTFTTLNAGGNVQLGDASSDVTTVSSQLTASSGLLVSGNPLYVNSNAITDSGGLVMTFDGSQNASFKGAILGASGYGSGDFSISSDGSGSFAGGLIVGNSGNGLGGTATFHGVETGEKAFYSPANNVFQVTGSAASGLQVSIGGDATSEYAVDVANGSNNNNKMRAAAFVTYSDESLKSDVSSMSSTALDTVMSLEGVEFTWKDSGERDFGFIAQDVQKVVPKAVHTADDGVQGVDYSRLTSVLVEAVKAQQVQIEELKALLKK